MDMILRALGIGLGTAVGILLIVSFCVWAGGKDDFKIQLVVFVFWVTVIVGGLAYMAMRQMAGL